MKSVCAIVAIACLCQMTTICARRLPCDTVEQEPATPTSVPAAGTSIGDSVTFLGTVTRIGVGGENRFKRWVVGMKVDKVLSGNFTAKTFSFAVHSPSKSGLELGKQYTIQATRSGDGYQVVEEQKWLGRDPSNE